MPKDCHDGERKGQPQPRSAFLEQAGGRPEGTVTGDQPQKRSNRLGQSVLGMRRDVERSEAGSSYRAAGRLMRGMRQVNQDTRHKEVNAKTKRQRGMARG